MSVKGKNNLNAKAIKSKLREAWQMPFRRAIMIAIPAGLVVGIVQVIVGAMN